MGDGAGVDLLDFKLVLMLPSGYNDHIDKLFNQNSAIQLVYMALETIL